MPNYRLLVSHPSGTPKDIAVAQFMASGDVPAGKVARALVRTYVADKAMFSVPVSKEHFRLIRCQDK